MSVQTNISLSGLTTGVNDELYVVNEYVSGTLEMLSGSTLILQPNSINDTALSSNVALKNANNTFTGINTFNTHQVTCNAGLISNNTLYTQNGAGNIQWQFTDTSNATTGTFQVNNNQLTLFSGGNNGSQIYQMRDSGGTIQNVMTLNYSNGSTFNGSTATTFNSGIIANNNGIQSNRAAGQSMLLLTDTTNSSTGNIYLNGALWNFINNLNNTRFYFKGNDNVGTQHTLLDLQYANPALDCQNPITQTATMPVSTDSSTKTPTTAWVQSAIATGISGITGVFILANNNTATGQNNFQNSGSNIPLTISTSSVANYVGNHFVSSGAGSYNPMVAANEYVVVGRNTATLGAGTLTLTTHSGTSGGIKISGNGNTTTFGNHTFQNYIIPSTVSNPSLNNASLGYIYGQNALSFNPAWTGQPPNQNIYTLNITGSGSPLVFGTYLVNTCIYFYSSGFPFRNIRWYKN